MRPANASVTARHAAAARHEADLRRECDRLGIAITKTSNVYRLRGHGVDILVADLRQIALHELQPPKS